MKRSILLAVVPLALLVAACSSTASATPAPADPGAGHPCSGVAQHGAAMGDIVATAKAAGTFSTLLRPPRLRVSSRPSRAPGPFTVFAPTDDAFAALPGRHARQAAGRPGGPQAGPPVPRRLGQGHVRPGRGADLGGLGRGLAHRDRRQGRQGLPERLGAGHHRRRRGLERRHPRHRPGAAAAGHGRPAPRRLRALPRWTTSSPRPRPPARSGPCSAAATAAGLVETLQGAGPFTVFAPTDEAFAALPAGTLDKLLADPEALKKVLLYHVVSGEVTADQVVGLTSADSVEGSPSPSPSRTARSTSTTPPRSSPTDIMASNGVIHVIDQVILPPSN